MASQQLLASYLHRAQFHGLIFLIIDSNLFVASYHAGVRSAFILWIFVPLYIYAIVHGCVAHEFPSLPTIHCVIRIYFTVVNSDTSWIHVYSLVLEYYGYCFMQSSSSVKLYYINHVLCEFNNKSDWTSVSYN